MKHQRSTGPDHLPIFGVGPLCVAAMALPCAVGLLLEARGLLPGGELGEPWRTVCAVGGIVLLPAALCLWVGAVAASRIDRAVRENRLVTTGVYAWVRNPIYSAIGLALTGVLLLRGNAWLLVLPPLFWAELTLLLRHTEERWLLHRYGEAYRAYCRRVNRCLPWPPRR